MAQRLATNHPSECLTVSCTPLLTRAVIRQASIAPKHPATPCFHFTTLKHTFHGHHRRSDSLVRSMTATCTRRRGGFIHPFFFYVFLFRYHRFSPMWRALTFLANSGTVSQPLLMKHSTNHRMISFGLGSRSEFRGELKKFEGPFRSILHDR